MGAGGKHGDAAWRLDAQVCVLASPGSGSTRSGAATRCSRESGACARASPPDWCAWPRHRLGPQAGEGTGVARFYARPAWLHPRSGAFASAARNGSGKTYGCAAGATGNGQAAPCRSRRPDQPARRHPGQGRRLVGLERTRARHRRDTRRASPARRAGRTLCGAQASALISFSRTAPDAAACGPPAPAPSSPRPPARRGCRRRDRGGPW